MSFLSGGGELGALIRAHDWATSPLGAVEGWPQSLCWALRMCLDSPLPTMLCWGPELVVLYNDTFRPFFGVDHPAALARPAREVWPGSWQALRPLLEHVATRGEGVEARDQLLPVLHGDLTEERYFDVAFNPLRGEDGRIDAVVNISLETTRRVVGERRTQLLQHLAEHTHGARSEANACTLAAEALREGHADVPFALLYRIESGDEHGAHAHLAGATRLEGGTAASPRHVALDTAGDEDEETRAWPLARVAREDAPAQVEDLVERFGALPGGPWDEPPQRAVVLPVRCRDEARPCVLLVLGVSPRRALDEDDHRFFDRIAMRVATAVSNARAYEALQRSEARYRSLFDSTQEGLFLGEIICAGETPIDWRYLEANPAFLALLGLPHEAVVGRRHRELFPDAPCDDLCKRFAAVALSGEPVHVPMHERRDGRDIEIIVFSPQRGQFAAIHVDITERRRAEAALREADRHKDAFLAMLSHELRNPLAPIRNSVYILERAAPGGPQAERAIAVIDRQARQMTRLIDDLLDVTRIARGKINLRRERVELNELARSTAEDHREVFVRNGVELEVHEADRPLDIDGDPTRLAQIIGNLLNNAAKFTPRGGRASLILEADDEMAVIRVRDTGAGIARETCERLFEPFVQADTTLDRSSGGLGLGLALVKGLAEMHGGRVEAVSEGRGKGAEFTVRLPLHATAKRRREAPRAPDGQDTTRRVLIIEDNVDAARTLRSVLELWGHQVEVAYSGTEGLARAHDFQPDVTLCDIGLPGIDGYAVARAIRADAQLRSTCLVALSGYARPEDVEKSREAGFARHLAKPADLAELERLIERAPTRTATS